MDILNIFVPVSDRLQNPVFIKKPHRVRISEREKLYSKNR